jgi:hypothetical protein
MKIIALQLISLHLLPKQAMEFSQRSCLSHGEVDPYLISSLSFSWIPEIDWKKLSFIINNQKTFLSWCQSKGLLHSNYHYFSYFFRSLIVFLRCEKIANVLDSQEWGQNLIDQTFKMDCGIVQGCPRHLSIRYSMNFEIIFIWPCSHHEK